MAAHYTPAQQGALDCQQQYPSGSQPPHATLYLKCVYSGDWMRYTATGGSCSTGLVDPANDMAEIDLLEQQDALSGHAGIVWGDPEEA